MISALRLGAFAGLVGAALTMAGTACADLDGAIDNYYAGRYEDAAAEFQKLADDGDGEAQLWLGYIYSTGEGIGRNWYTARDWYERAIENGNATAYSFLGDLYYNGQGVTQDYMAAARYYRQGANLNDAGAQYSLGLAYELGEGAPRDVDKALALSRA